MKKFLLFFVLLLLNVSTYADNFDIVGTWYQYESDQETLDGIWIFKSDKTGSCEEFHKGESEGVDNFTYDFNIYTNILTIWNEGEEDEPSVMHITVVSSTEFTYAEHGEVLTWVKKPIVATGVPINDEHFPDEIFRNFLLDQNFGRDGVLTEEEIKNVTRLDVTKDGIVNLKGVEFFTELTYLYCSYSTLAALDISKNTRLKELYCAYNNLTTLDISKNIVLERLVCAGNKLTSLDVSYNTELVYLDCANNRLTSLDVPKNTKLQSLICSENQLTSLDVSNCLEIHEIYFGNNYIKGNNMDELIKTLPERELGFLYVIASEWKEEGNEITKAQVTAAKAKGWQTLRFDIVSFDWVEYEGSDPTGIHGIYVDDSNPIFTYSLSGQKLAVPYKGINIIKGKKILVR